MTLEWLRTLFAGNGLPGLVSARLVDANEGTATKIRLQLDWEAGCSGPARVIAKGGFGPHRLPMSYLYAHETRFYRQAAPLLPVAAPACYGVAEDPERRQYVAVLEDLDLRGVRYCRVDEPLDKAQAMAFLDMLAAMHARFWGSPELDGEGCFAKVELWDALPPGPRGTYARGQLEPVTFRHYLDLPRGRALSQIFHQHAKVKAALKRLSEFGKRRPWCLIHSDFHLGNLYHNADGSPGALDWQTWARGHWAQDVAYFIISALDMIDRRRWVDELMDHYLSALARHGVAAPGHAEAMEAFRIHIIYGLFYWLTNPPEWQSEANNSSIAPRFGMAAIDHGLLDDL